MESDDDHDPGAGGKMLGSAAQGGSPLAKSLPRVSQGSSFALTLRLLKRMGLENLLLIISHWDSGRMSKTSKSHDARGRFALTSRQQ